MNFFVALGLGSGLAGAAAFRLFFPFILTGVLVKYAANIELPSALDWLSATPVLVLMLCGLVIEYLLDYFPGVSFLHTSIYSVLKILGGGILFASVLGWNAWIGVPIGGLITGFLNLAHLTFAPIIERELRYFRGLEYSLIENLASIVLTILAATAPLLSLIVLGVLVYGVFRMGRRVSREVN